MRAHLFTHSYLPEHSPPQRRWTQLIRTFCELGWEVEVVAPVAHSPAGRRTLPRKVAGRAFRTDRGRYGESIRRAPYLWHPTTRMGRFADQCFSAAGSVLAALMGPRPDVVIATVPSLPILGAGFVVAKLRGVPFVADMRDAWPDIARDARLVQGGAKGLVERAIVAIQQRADLIVTVTYGFAQILRDRGLSNVTTITNGIDTANRELLPPPAEESDLLEVLYLGNHGESQQLETIIEAAALCRNYVRLTMVGHGVQRRHLQALAESLDAPVEFHEPVQGTPAVMSYYRRADTCVISLRDDWKSFETTIPSKTYEVLAVGRHVTGVVLGEAREIIEDCRAGDVVRSDPALIAALWKELAGDRRRLATGSLGRDWVELNANVGALGRRYSDLLTAVVMEKRSQV